VKRAAAEFVGWVVVVLFALAVGWVVARQAARLVGADLPTFDAGLIATFAGVVAGVPVALLLGSISSRAGNRSASRERSDARRRVLRVIQRDLNETMAELVARDRNEVVGRTLRTDVWQTLSASGELALIADPDLVNVLARAYHFVATTSDLERQLWLAYHDPAQWTLRRDHDTGAEVSGRHRLSLAASISDIDPHTKAAVDVALTELASVFGEPPPPNLPLRVDRPDDDRTA
jgi:hypothetical protein